MIFNISGRTDIVNHYSKWLLKRINEGYVYSRNPYNHHQITKYSLKPPEVDALIFCSKNYKPLLDEFSKINHDYNIFSYYTITSYGNDIEVNVPSVDESIDTLLELSQIIGKNKIAWRFDPILLTCDYTIDKHLDCFGYIASQIADYTSFVTFSFVDMYNKLKVNMPEIIPFTQRDFQEIIKGMGEISKKYDLSIQSCLINDNYEKYGIKNSGCVTTEILEKANNIKFKNITHRGMRQGCKCLKWHDFGAYNTCPNACKYCYANKNSKIAQKNYEKHDVNSPILFGKISNNDKISIAKEKSLLLRDKNQTTLF
ncbi:DUF1848 domain-containing protein [Methanosphaera sp.]